MNFNYKVFLLKAYRRHTNQNLNRFQVCRRQVRGLEIEIWLRLKLLIILYQTKKIWIITTNRITINKSKILPQHKTQNLIWEVSIQGPNHEITSLDLQTARMILENSLAIQQQRVLFKISWSQLRHQFLTVCWVQIFKNVIWFKKCLNNGVTINSKALLKWLQTAIQKRQLVHLTRQAPSIQQNITVD